jgi:hypothetical protein
LVRSDDGRNLLVIEVKAPDGTLTSNDRDQAISYARMLDDGGIAPFSVVTNGRDTNIYDTITKELLTGQHIPVNHPHVRAGFRISGADLTLRAEALEMFIGLSKDNLLLFCKLQVDARIRALRSDDPNSGRKYIPSLYVERPTARARLDDRLSKGDRVVLVVAPPQVGKTNLLCRVVEDSLRAGRPCLFYPPVGMGSGLIQEMVDDFEWETTSTLPARSLLSKIGRITRDCGERLLLVIDGLNEAARDLALVIERDCERISDAGGVQIVISFVDSAATRLLLDSRGNATYLARASELTTKSIERLEMDSSSVDPSWRIVSLHNYDAAELSAAYSRYATVFGVSVPGSHLRTSDPFLLRVAMEHYQGTTLPATLDEQALIESCLRGKARRSTRSVEECSAILREVGRLAFEKGVPLGYDVAARACGLLPGKELPSGLFEAAMLARVPGASNLPAVDFYYGREGDYVISYWAREWHRSLQTAENTDEEYERAVGSNAGISAFRWFHEQPLVLRAALKRGLASYRNAGLRRLLLKACVTILSRTDHMPRDRAGRRIPSGRGRGSRLNWMEDAISAGSVDSDMAVRAEAVKLFAVGVHDEDDLTDAIVEDRTFIESFLEIDSVYPFQDDGIGRVVVRAFENFRARGGLVEDILGELVRGSGIGFRSGGVPGAAAKLLAVVNPRLFLTIIGQEIERSTQGDLFQAPQFGAGATHTDEADAAIRMAIRSLDDEYYGSGLCPTYISALRSEPDRLIEEYNDMLAICRPLMAHLSMDSRRGLTELLDALHPNHVE